MVGYLITRLRQLGWSENRALGAQALLRGSYHLYQGLGGFVGNLAMGLLFGRLWQRQNRLWVLVGAHTLIDVVAFLGYAVLHGRVGWLPVRPSAAEGGHDLGGRRAVGQQGVVQRGERALRGLGLDHAAGVVDDHREQPEVRGVARGGLDADLEDGADQDQRRDAAVAQGAPPAACRPARTSRACRTRARRRRAPARPRSRSARRPAETGWSRRRRGPGAARPSRCATPRPRDGSGTARRAGSRTPGRRRRGRRRGSAGSGRRGPRGRVRAAGSRPARRTPALPPRRDGTSRRRCRGRRYRRRAARLQPFTGCREQSAAGGGCQQGGTAGDARGATLLASRAARRHAGSG